MEARLRRRKAVQMSQMLIGETYEIRGPNVAAGFADSTIVVHDGASQLFVSVNPRHEDLAQKALDAKRGIPVVAFAKSNGRVGYRFDGPSSANGVIVKSFADLASDRDTRIAMSDKQRAERIAAAMQAKAASRPATAAPAAGAGSLAGVNIPQA